VLSLNQVKVLVCALRHILVINSADFRERRDLVVTALTTNLGPLPFWMPMLTMLEDVPSFSFFD
jgi:hypothetical protein